MRMMNRVLSFVVISAVHFADATQASNPIIWSDVPDLSMIRVGESYYMSSTTMHMSPGVPIMKSTDLSNWSLVGYAYDRLVENDAMNLENGQNCYGAGSWASSLRFHNGMFYVSTFSATSGRTHIYSTEDVENGPWKERAFAPKLHDHSLFFDDDGKVYMVYGGGKLSLVELEPDLSGIKSGGVDQVIVENANLLFGADEVGGLNAEGSQLFKHEGKYYLFNIASPKSRWSRTVLIHRADKITGPWEGRIALEDRGIAQGGLIDTPDGNWYAYLFGDRGAVGRIPYLTPVEWKDGWPVLGRVPDTLELPDNAKGIYGIVASDEFERKAGDPSLPLAWQWNHNPDNENWAVLQNPGRLRLTAGRVDADVLSARNMLTQRTFGPVCSSTTCVSVSGMKDGDVAGLIALQKKYGYVGVKMEHGKKSIVMVSAQHDAPEEIESIPLNQKVVYFRIDCDFRNQIDEATFYYSLDGKSWRGVGNTLKMAYTLPHFMGYRFGLFNYATKTPGGYVEFDFYRVCGEIPEQ